MSESLLFSPTTVGPLSLRNRIVMAPMTRCRAVHANQANALMAQYYAQRATAGLIVTEGTATSPNGAGYVRMPGIWSQEQVDAWKPVTKGVHDAGGHIVVQLMHTGRVGHRHNLPKGAEVLAPSAVAAPGEMYTDAAGMQAFAVPRAMTSSEVETARDEFVSAARNALAAGFDGVELHGANGYLIEEFLSPVTNLRDDGWGGSVEKRLRFPLEVAQAVAQAIGGDRVGIRLSPYGASVGMTAYPEIDETYQTLVARLVATGIQTVHLVDHSSMGAPEVPSALKRALRLAWPRTFLVCGGFDRLSAEAELSEGRADLVGFGRPFIANPDFTTRLAKGLALTAADGTTFYTSGPEGYTDYLTA